MSEGKTGNGLENVDLLTRQVRGDVNIYQLISPENESEQKQRFEQHIHGEPPTGVEAEEDLEVVDSLTRDTVLNSVSFDRDIGPEELESLDPWTPDFRYEEPRDYSRESERLEEARNEVDSSETSETVQRVYHDTLDEMEALIDIAENVGDSSVVRDQASREIYGEPSDEVIKWAEDTLENIEPGEPQEAEFTASDMGESIQGALDTLGMDDWSVGYTEKGVVSVNGAKQEILVPEEREFTENEIKRLLVHEVGTHALRGANGYEQEYEVLGSGAGGYHLAEEGLAFFMEKETGLADPDLERKYAGRLLSVESVMNGDDLAETYRMNRELGFDHDQSWSLATRAHRGGGFVKDHIYAEGYQKVDEYLKEEGGDLEDLMVGKVSIEQGRDLRQEEGLEPEYSPVELLENLDDLTPESVDVSDVDTEALEEYYSGLT
jgi:hypothetical protein